MAEQTILTEEGLKKLEDELDYGFENSKKTVCLKK